MFWTPGCTIMIQWMYSIHCIHYYRVCILFKYTGTFFKKLSKYWGPRGRSDVRDLGHYWARAEKKASLDLAVQWWRQEQFWEILMQEVKGGLGQRRNNRLHLWTFWANSPLPSGNNEEVRGGQKQQRGQGHTMEERQVWPQDHCHLHSSLPVSNPINSPFILFLRDFIYLFLERGEGREKEWERNIDVRDKHQSVPSCTCPNQDQIHNPGMCPDWV